MSSNSSASSYPPKNKEKKKEEGEEEEEEEDEEDDNVSQFGYGSRSENEGYEGDEGYEGVSSSSDEDEPILTEQESIKKFNETVAAHDRLPIETQLRLNHTLEAARDPFGRTNVERREWERKNGAGGGGGGTRSPRYDAEGRRIIESAAVFNANNAAARARAANQTIYYPPVPPPPPQPVPVTVTGNTAAPAPVTGTAAATEATEVPLRRRGTAAKREEDDFKGVSQRDPRTGKSFCEKLGEVGCSIQGGSRKSRKVSKKSKKSRKAKKSKKSKKSKLSTSRKVKRHQ